MQKKRTIIDDAEIYVYFELIERLAPKRILDFGMFLKRIGTVSRQAMDREIPSDVWLEAVDLFPEIKLPVYKRVYDEITPLTEWRGAERYDLVTFFSVNEFLSEEQKKTVWKKLTEIADCVIADTTDPVFVQFLIDHFRAEAVETDGKTYAVAYRK